ncbi:MAG: NAD(P)-dependent oxidoreductase, partial [Dehalococcoidia bacterium]
MSRVFVARRLPGDAVDVLRRSVEVELWQEELPPPHDVLLRQARACDGLMTLVTDRIDAALLDQAPSLKVVSNVAVGLDNVDVAAATARGVVITNTPGVLTETTADFAFALLMAAARRVVEGDRYTREGRWKTWDPSLLLGTDLYGATLGIVGLGQIGIQVAKRATGFDMKLLYYDVRRNEQAERDYGV